MPYSSPLRYPGGKRQLTNFIKLILGVNNLQDGHYIEPYAGGASIAITLLFHEYVRHVHINDLSYQLYAFWHSVLHQTDDLCKLINDVKVDMDEWYRQKGIYRDPQNSSILSVGFATFFLNRTNRSGILNGGVIGGKEQNGEYKLDVRFNKQGLINRIERIASYKNRISLYNYDAAQFLTTVLPSVPISSLVYLDPPYYVKGKDLYDNHYTLDDHRHIAKLVTAQIKQKWIVSYDNVPEIQELYKGWPQSIYSLNYSATDRYKGSEIMFFSDQLAIPPLISPVQVKPKQIATMLPLAF